MQVYGFGLMYEFQYNTIVSVRLYLIGILSTASLISICYDRTLNPAKLWSGSAEAITYSEIPKDQKSLKHKKARLHLNKIGNLTFKWRTLKVTREGRAGVERFLHSSLSVSSLVSFISSDSSPLQIILPSSLSSLQQFCTVCFHRIILARRDPQDHRAQC